MLRQDDQLFFRLPKEDTPGRRVLRPAVVVGLENQVCVLRLPEPCRGIEPPLDVLLHFEARRKFMQQLGRVIRKDSEQPLILAVQLIGSPISSESRQCYRVSCLGSNIRATIDSEPGCEVVDLSATGIAFYARNDYPLAVEVRVILTHVGKTYEGHATIMSCRRMTPKTIRYGALCRDLGRDTLARSLAAINLEVQGEQQRRMSGKA